MNVICVPMKPVWQDLVWPVGKLLFEKAIRKPAQGMMEIAKGLHQAVPELATAVQEAIDNHLSPEARAKVIEGVERVAKGWQDARWALLLVALLVFCSWNGPLVTMAGGALFLALV